MNKYYVSFVTYSKNCPPEFSTRTYQEEGPVTEETIRKWQKDLWPYWDWKGTEYGDRQIALYGYPYTIRILAFSKFE